MQTTHVAHVFGIGDAISSQVVTSCLVGLWFGEKFSALMTMYYGTYMSMVLELRSENVDWFNEIWTHRAALGTVQQVCCCRIRPCFSLLCVCYEACGDILAFWFVVMVLK